MEKRLRHVPFTVLRLDEILILEKMIMKISKNLDCASDIMRRCGLQLKQKNCVSKASKLTYLGFQTNKKGVNPLPEKVIDLLNAETVKNTTQLKSFLGMLNGFYRDFSKLAHILEPLHKLLC